MLQYYRDLWKNSSEVLAPLTESTKVVPTKKGPIKWNSDCTEEFQKMKSLITKDSIFAYPYLSRNFTIHTETSDVQLWAIIMQEGKLLAFYSKKLSKVQINFTITE